jgi:ABC-2 type transport system permease protein
LRWLSDVLPLTYAVDGMQEVAASTSVTGDLAVDIAVVVGCIAVALAIGAATLPRRTP